MDRMPKPSEIVYVTKAASVQFVTRPILFRVVRVRDDLTTYVGWVYLDGYELDTKGDAVERRTIWVQPAGLRYVGTAPDPRARRSRNTGPAIPRPRTTTENTTRRNR